MSHVFCIFSLSFSFVLFFFFCFRDFFCFIPVFSASHLVLFPNLFCFFYLFWIMHNVTQLSNLYCHMSFFVLCMMSFYFIFIIYTFVVKSCWCCYCCYYCCSAPSIAEFYTFFAIFESSQHGVYFICILFFFAGEHQPFFLNSMLFICMSKNFIFFVC